MYKLATTKDIGQISVSWVWPPPKQGADNKKKSSRKTIMQPQGSRGKEVHLEHPQMLKETTQEIPVSTKKPGGGRARGHILSDGTEVLQLRVCWKLGNCTMLETRQCWLLENRNFHYLLSFKPQPHFSWFPWGNKATALLACSPNNVFEICWPNLTL